MGREQIPCCLISDTEFFFQHTFITYVNSIHLDLSDLVINKGFETFRPILKVTEDDTSLGILPFFHIYGMCPVMMGVLIDGGKLVTLPKFEPEMFLKALEAQKVVDSKIFRKNRTSISLMEREMYYLICLIIMYFFKNPNATL